MLENPIKREAAKGLAQVGGAALVTGNKAVALVTMATAAALGIAFEALAYLGNRRTAELFDEQLAEQVVNKIHASDDFAGFVYDIWQKHNLESSKERRQYLKHFLSREAHKENNAFENFSRIEYLLQNVSLKALRLLKAFHSPEIYGYRGHPDNESGHYINLKLLTELLDKKGFNMPAPDVEYNLNELVHYNLVAVLHGRWDGPLYNHTKLAFVLLEYIDMED